MKSTLEILIGARARIADPAHWIRFWFAANAQRAQVSVLSRNACSFCAKGAIINTVGTDAFSEPVNIAENTLTKWLLTKGHGPYIGMYNDSHTHAGVLAMFDGAIETLRIES